MSLIQSLRTIVRRTVPMLGAAVILSACGSDDVPDIPSNPAVETYAAALGVNIAQMTKKSDDLFIQDLVVGTGPEAVVGRNIDAHYTGWLINGQRFDSSAGGAPIGFTFGVGQVIPGWDQGIQGMKVGGKRKLVIGSRLAYGRRGQGPIPANATLVFDVELVAVR
jgi:FKBP-type peptidyl-prolyl cis-trans isomerase FkpA